jgi:hypothetical protein
MREALSSRKLLAPEQMNSRLSNHHTKTKNALKPPRHRKPSYCAQTSFASHASCERNSRLAVLSPEHSLEGREHSLEGREHDSSPPKPPRASHDRPVTSSSVLPSVSKVGSRTPQALATRATNVFAKSLGDMAIPTKSSSTEHDLHGETGHKHLSSTGICGENNKTTRCTLSRGVSRRG